MADKLMVVDKKDCHYNVHKRQMELLFENQSGYKAVFREESKALNLIQH